jgi:hypothetical protein
MPVAAYLKDLVAAATTRLIGVVVSSWSPWRLPVSGMDAWSETLLSGNRFE